ncbi:MAG: FAD-dependent oxidoreductase [Paludibacter sp.]|nr:FAD-dependent oxidoreductase [Paludibacter sp.]
MAIVKKYPVEIVDIQHPIVDVYTLELKSLGKPFKYESGQFLHLAIDEYDPTEPWPESRCFSMQSAPCEENIRITYVVNGQFTKRIQNELIIGKQITIKLPYGELFLQDHNKTKTIFIAGGTGITPFLSLFTNTSFADYTEPILYAGFKNKKTNIYKIELETAKKVNDGFDVRFIYQDRDGKLDIEKIYLQSHKESSFFISGPPEMIKNFKLFLLNQKVSENQIFIDGWE